MGSSQGKDTKIERSNQSHESSSWIKHKCSSHDHALNFLIKYKNQIGSSEVLKYKFNIKEIFDKFQSEDLKKIQLKFVSQSIVIFIASNHETRFHIYWQSKDISEILFLKPYEYYFSENDKDLCEFVANFLANSLEDKHLGTQKDLDLSAYNLEINLHLLADTQNHNLLIHASKSGIEKPITNLLRYGIETQICEQSNVLSAQDLAWQGRHSNILIKLLEANLPFPSKIDIDECSEILKNFIEMSEEFHKMILGQNKDIIHKLLKQYPNLRYFYNLSNISALKAALDSKLIDIYEFLISKNLSFAPHEDVDEIWKKFDKSSRIKLRNINLKHLKNIPEKHINILMFNTFVNHDETDEEGKRKLILRAYRALNTDLRLKIILKIVAATKIFKIIFDFNLNSTNRIDPMTGSETQGIFYSSGRIIVGAKLLLNPETEHEAHGVLIHELCHYAVLVAYQNKSNPFEANDQQAKEEFERIAELCKVNMNYEPIIQSVFDDYPIEHQLPELIVRPAHLIALYVKEPELLQELILNFSELFNYYFNFVIPAMERALPEIENKLAFKSSQLYADLSDQDKERVQNANIEYKNVKVKLIELFPENSEIFMNLSSDHISQILSNKVLDINNPQLRYLKEQIDLKWSNLPESMKLNILRSNIIFQGKILKIDSLFKLYPDAFNALTSQQIVNVLDGNQIEIGKEFKTDIKFYVERNFVPEDAKLIAFEYEIGHEYTSIMHDYEEHIKNRRENKSFQKFSNETNDKNFDQISELCDKLKDNPLCKLYSNYFNLNDKEFHFMFKSSNQIINEAKNKKILIISSEAGAGKTATFEQLSIEIKSNFSTQWVSYIDLPKYTKHFKTNESNEILLKEILNLNSEKCNFEVRIFEECFKSGNMVLIWNAFDEISPAYNEFVLDLLKNIYETSSITQLVCTRPLYSNQLCNGVKVRAWQLVPFDKEKKQEFLERNFKSQGVLSENLQENIEKVEKIIQKFEKVDEWIYNFNTPLILQLIANIHNNDGVCEPTNIYVIFEAFVESKIQIWLEKSKNNFGVAKKLLFSGSLKLIFQKYGLLNEFGYLSGTTFSMKMRKLQIMQKRISKNFPIEEISKMGILFINGKNNFQFSHKSLSEFFVAQYFIENLFYCESVDSDEAELRLEMFYYLVKAYGDLQQIITDFMTSYLQTIPQIQKKFNPTISLLLRTKFRSFFVRMLDTNYPKIFEFLFNFFKFDHDLLVEMLHIHEKETFYTAIFNLNYFSLATNPEEIENLARNFLTGKELQKFLTGKDQKGKILLGIHFYALIGITKFNTEYSAEIDKLIATTFWDFLNKIKDILTLDEQKELFIVTLSPKIYMFYNKIFSTADFHEYRNHWTNYENLLTNIEMQNVIGEALLLYFEIDLDEKTDNEKLLYLLAEKAEKFLSSSQIMKMFLDKCILHEAYWNLPSFEIVWSLISNHTNKEERREILRQDDLGDKNFYFRTISNDPKKKNTNDSYQYYFYDFTPFKIIHRAFTIPAYHDFNYIKEIYRDHFKNFEIQELIFSSNDFLYYAIGKNFDDLFKNIVSFIKKISEGNEMALKNYLKQKIDRTELSVFELVEDYRGLPWIMPDVFENLNTLSNLLNDS